MEFIYKSEDEMIICGIVLQGTPPELYETPYVDSQGEWYKQATVEEAARELLEKNERVCFDVQHSGSCYFFDVLESFVAEEDMTKHGKLVKKGAWVMTVKCTSPKVWARIKARDLNSFSVAGVGMV